MVRKLLKFNVTVQQTTFALLQESSLRINKFTMMPQINCFA